MLKKKKVTLPKIFIDLCIVGRSKCPSYIGVEGILLRETQNTLQLISVDNKIRSKGSMTIVLSV